MGVPGPTGVDTTAAASTYNNDKPRSSAPIVVAFVFCLLLLVAAPLLTRRGGKGRELVLTDSSVIPERLQIAIIADMDHASKVSDSKKPQWRSIFKIGHLSHDGDGPSPKFSIAWDEDRNLETHHSEAGRGMELSDLVRFDGRMWTCDDRSGILFEVINWRPGAIRDVETFPRHIIMEGDGNTDKGFKCEWLAVKDGKLHIGSFGKEFTNNDGAVVNRNNNWVMTYERDGRLQHVDWTDRYDAMREALGYEFPGYLLHETAVWSDIRQQWLWLPRRMSKEPYDDVRDQTKGANTAILTNANGKVLDSFTVTKLTPERGFSSAKFVPGSGDRIVVALKSEEDAAAGTQSTYITVFDIETRQTLLEETKIPGDFKYEGVEIISCTADDAC